MQIGYYAHHHGSGHCRQADKLAALLPNDSRDQLTVFTSLEINTYRFDAIEEQHVVRLHAEDERTDDVLSGRPGEYWKPACLHYSPVGNIDIQKRSHQIIEAIYQRHIDLMIVDVSAEVAMLCRAASVPYLYVRLPGIRDDTAHLSAFAGALALLAPYPQALESAHTPQWVCDKTLYLDFIYSPKNEALGFDKFMDVLTQLRADNDSDNNITNSASTSVSTDTQSSPLGSTHNTEYTTPIVTVIKGYGGHEAIDAKLPELRALLPNALIISLGPIAEDKRCYVDIAAHVEDVIPFIAHSDYLIMACGLNAVAQAYHYDTPLVVVPDERPHQEQAVMAQALIDQKRALSWQKFTASLADKGELQPISDNDNNHHQKKEKEKTYSPNITNNQENKQKRLAAAQALMDSMATYPTAKHWFEAWLLPKLTLKPDCEYAPTTVTNNT